MKLTSYSHVMRNVYYILDRMNRAYKVRSDQTLFISENECSPDEQKFLSSFQNNIIKVVRL